MSSVPTTSIVQPTVLGLITEYGHRAADTLTKFVQRAIHGDVLEMDAEAGGWWPRSTLEERLTPAS
jgi:hypothetical protein